MPEAIRTSMVYSDASNAVKDAQQRGKSAVGWNAKKRGWVVYYLTDGASEGTTPEILCLGSGKPPIGLNDLGWAVLESVLNKAGA